MMPGRQQRSRHGKRVAMMSGKQQRSRHGKRVAIMPGKQQRSRHSKRARAENTLGHVDDQHSCTADEACARCEHGTGIILLWTFYGR